MGQKLLCFISTLNALNQMNIQLDFDIQILLLY